MGQMNWDPSSDGWRLAQRLWRFGFEYVGRHLWTSDHQEIGAVSNGESSGDLFNAFGWEKGIWEKVDLQFWCLSPGSINACLPHPNGSLVAWRTHWGPGNIWEVVMERASGEGWHKSLTVPWLPLPLNNFQPCERSVRTTVTTSTEWSLSMTIQHRTQLQTQHPLRILCTEVTMVIRAYLHYHLIFNVLLASKFSPDGGDMFGRKNNDWLPSNGKCDIFEVIWKCSRQ